jgi:hypothetical protein
MSKKVELILSKTYVYKGKIFEKGRPYVVSDSDSKHLLAQRNERDIPYFRMTDAGPAHMPANKRSDKGGTPPLAPDEDQIEPIVADADDSVVDDVDDADAVTV